MSNALWSPRAEEECRQLVELALAEDIADGLDCTTAAIVDPSIRSQAAFVSRERGIVCGLRPADIILEKSATDLKLHIQIEDGGEVESGSCIANIEGRAADILTVERTILNFMGRLSGIASLARRFVDQVAGTRAKVYDTRKTTPAWRHLEKYAVKCGGAENHRLGLFDAILIKDNHLAFAAAQVDKSQAIQWAVERARTWIQEHHRALPHGPDTIVQVEVDNLQQLSKVWPLPVDIVLLDNMSTDLLEQAVQQRNERAPHIQLEASGGVNLQTVGKIAQTGVDRISAGALTHSATNFDIGLDWQTA